MAFRVLVDACVLIPMGPADLLLRLADSRQFTILWSRDILDEVERNLSTALSIPPAKAHSRVQAMQDAFPDAMIRNYGNLIPAMTNHEKDRHVLAAAVRGNAETIVTDNIKDFPPATLEPYDIGIRTADEFLLDQLDLNYHAVSQAIDGIIGDMRNPEMDKDTYCLKLHQTGLPRLSKALRRRNIPTHTGAHSRPRGHGVRG